MKLFRFTIPISRLKLNLLANFAGAGWSTLMGLLFIPLYIRFMGIEAYGLIGFYIALQGALQILDFGLSPTMNREMARYSVQPERAGEARDLVRTLEIGYWAIGLAIGAVIYALAPFIATHWIRAIALPTSVVQAAVVSMGVLSALQWPLTFYQGGLLGLQRQAALNALLIAMSTLRYGGVALILWRVSPTITAFFAWQIVVSAVQVSLITLLLWRSLPAANHAPHFQPSLLKNIWRFAAGMSGITLATLILTQVDKVILSKLLSLELFGYYTLAGVVSNGLAMIASPVFNVVFPQLSALAAIGDTEAIKRFYHRSAQIMAVIILPVAALLALFAIDVLRLWTGNLETARNTASIASLLVIGTAINNLMSIPYALQLAHGWTGIVLRIIIFLLITLVPMIIFMATHYGPIGAAAVWMVLNVIYMLIGIPLTHARLLKGEGWRWFIEDFGLPLLGVAIVAGGVRWLITSPLSTHLAIAYLPGIFIGTLSIAILAASQIRAWIWEQLSGVVLRHA